MKIRICIQSNVWIYRYEILSLPSNGKGIAAVNADPTVTMTVGASTDQDKPVKVAMSMLNSMDGVMAINLI